MKQYVSVFKKENLKEEDESSQEEKAKKAIKDLIDTDFGGSNEEQYKASQMIQGLAGNKSDVSNEFMKDLNALTDKMDKSKYGVE